MTDGQDMPDTVEAALAELDAAAAKRSRARSEQQATSERCRALVVHLLRLGVHRKDLLNRPFTNRAITKIQEQEGLTRKSKNA